MFSQNFQERLKYTGLELISENTFVIAITVMMDVSWKTHYTILAIVILKNPQTSLILEL